MVVAVNRSCAEPILLGPDATAVVVTDGGDKDDVAGEGRTVSSVGLLLRCVGIWTGSDLALGVIELSFGDLLRGGDVPASNAAACSDRRLLVRISSFSFRFRACRFAVAIGTNERGTIIMNMDRRLSFLKIVYAWTGGCRGSDPAYLVPSIRYWVLRGMPETACPERRT